MIHIDLFSGLGLFSYAADRVWNLEHVFCEIEDWPYKFLKQEYPDARIERDVKEFDGTEYAGRTFLLTGGPASQPASVAGKRKGTKDDRWLWPEVAASTCIRGVDVSFTDGIYTVEETERNRTARLKALGNTIQWEVAYQVMMSIKETTGVKK